MLVHVTVSTCGTKLITSEEPPVTFLLMCMFSYPSYVFHGSVVIVLSIKSVLLLVIGYFIISIIMNFELVGFG